MGVIPPNLLPEDGLKEQTSDFMDLTFGSVIETSDENVTHDKVDETNNTGTKSKVCDPVEKILLRIHV
jgi:hypothetical protein